MQIRQKHTMHTNAYTYTDDEKNTHESGIRSETVVNGDDARINHIVCFLRGRDESHCVFSLSLSLSLCVCVCVDMCVTTLKT